MNMDKILKQVLTDLQEISVLVYELFRYDLRNEKLSQEDLVQKAWRKSHEWMNTEQSLLFGKKPIDVILTNDGESIKNFLKDKMGIEHD